MASAKRNIFIPLLSFYTVRMRSQRFRSDAFRQIGALAWVRGLTCLAVLVSIPYSAGISQAPIAPNGGNPGVGRSSSGFPALSENANPHPDGVRILEDSMKSQEDQKKIAEQNLARQKEMSADTAKLLQLATELKEEMDKSSKDTLSMNVVRKAEQIEKLAHTVREKMKASVGN
jgi:hypothetical protein